MGLKMSIEWVIWMMNHVCSLPHCKGLRTAGDCADVKSVWILKSLNWLKSNTNPDGFIGIMLFEYQIVYSQNWVYFYFISNQFLYCAGITHIQHYVNLGSLKKGISTYEGHIKAKYHSGEKMVFWKP